MKTNSTVYSCKNQLIDFSGTCNSEDVTEVINVFPYWKQMYIPENLTIPSYKPEAEQINSVDIEVKIISAKVIKTPSSYTTGSNPIAVPNLEGKTLTGRKLVIEGQLCQKIVYTGNSPDQPVHSVDFYVPFSSFIVVPLDITFTSESGAETVLDSLDVKFEVNSCIEDISACLNNPRNILKQVTLLLYAVPTQA